MRAILRLLALLGAVLALPAAAQEGPGDVAVLVADQVFVNADSQLIATGNVEALHGDIRLTASAITYDQPTDQLFITGPIRISQGESIVVLADAAELDPALENGILRGARLVLDQQVQLAALQMDRVAGRYTQLYKVAVTSCRICEGEGPPIWQIRARRVVHDQQERQLYFDGAQLRVLGLPVIWLPRLRMPDPTLERATGFLVPRVRSNSELGTGLKLPYFIRLGDHADVTLTPFVTPVTNTLEFRYRQAFARGRIDFDGAISGDTLLRDETRGYVFGTGNFTFGAGYKLNFDIEVTTDEAYLLDYGYSSKDRLDSAIEVTRTRPTDYFSAGLIHFETLRGTEAKDTQPALIGDVLYDHRFFPAMLGGQGLLRLQAHSHYRYSDNDVVGRDVTRANVELGWGRTWTGPAGLRFGLRGQLNGDLFNIQQDSSSDDNAFSVQPAVAADLRWPLTKAGRRAGVSHLLEPMVAISWSEMIGTNTPNEESTRVEFDEGNLLAFSRFPAPDRRDEGLQAAAGLSWQRFDPAGWSTRLTFGRIYRDAPAAGLSASSGLAGEASDWLLGGQIITQDGLSLTARALFDDQFDFAKSETRASWRGNRLRLSAAHVFLTTDPDEARASAVSELTLDGSWDINRHWTGQLDWRYDVASERTARAGAGLTYENECITMTLSASRRFTSSDNVDPSTEFDFLIGLRGFGNAASSRSKIRSCGNR